MDSTEIHNKDLETVAEEKSRSACHSRCLGRVLGSNGGTLLVSPKAQLSARSPIP